ncbi:MAG: AAA family ATPase, partial [Haloferula sp.]
ILELVRGENASKGGESRPEPVSQESIFAARDEVNAVTVSKEAAQYIVDLIMATRRPADFDEELAAWITVGASPRATIALDAASRARAWLQGRDYVSPEDIQAMAPACLAHRIHPSYEAEAAGMSRDDLVKALVERVAVTA